MKPYFRKKASRAFERVDGQPRRWDLTQCASKYWEGKTNPVTENLRFFIGLRDRIEHRDFPELDVHIFGECQALLMNFENYMEAEFGRKWCLGETLNIPLQLSRVRTKEQNEALRTLLRPKSEELATWIDGFRTGLSAEVFESMEYSHRVLLVPNVKNNPSRDALAIEFVPYVPGKNPQLDTAVTLIKERTVPVVNLGFIKPGVVVKRVNDVLRRAEPVTLSLHTQAWRFFHVRPAADDPHPENCDPRYCHYDSAHADYLYTQGWVDLLVSELAKPERATEIMNFGRATTTAGALSGVNAPARAAS
jgi:hypothetical protein